MVLKHSSELSVQELCIINIVFELVCQIKINNPDDCLHAQHKQGWLSQAAYPIGIHAYCLTLWSFTKTSRASQIIIDSYVCSLDV